MTANVIQGIFFQTQEMKLAFSEFPEVLMVDATYKLNDIRMPLYVLMIIDGNGTCALVVWVFMKHSSVVFAVMCALFT